MNSVDRATASPDLARRKFWRIPNRDRVWLFLRELIRVNCLWLVVYGGSSYLTGLHEYRVRLWTELDMRIPFVPQVAGVYLSLFPMLWLSLLALDTPERLKSFARSLTWLILVSGVGFLLFPCDDAYASRVPSDSFGTLFQIADRVNLSYNYLPSLHVGMAVVCAYAYSQAASRKLATIYWFWAIAIAASALLTHQHYLADIATGTALGYFIAARFTCPSNNVE